MLIDAEIIRQAKEKLGDRTPNIIVDELAIEKWDEKNLKGCCPFHNEKTPSFVYDKKTMRFHCFGCDKTIDILDAYISKGNTYIESVQKLFDLTGTEYSFGEQNVKTKSAYRYPKPVECNSKERVYDYWSKRKISKETIDFCNVQEDDKGNTVFNYYDTNDVLTMVKYRPSRKIDKSKGDIKCWCQKDADTTPLLWGMNCINTSIPLLITEGEGDRMSAIESGYHNAVSIPLGAGNFHWIEECWNWLSQFDTIIVCSDNDAAGKKMRDEVAHRLGSWRCKTVDVPTSFTKETGEKIKIKDLNEVLYWYGKEKVLEIILNATSPPVMSVDNVGKVNDTDIDKIAGVRTGFKKLDAQLFKLFYGTLTVLTAKPGAGKTSWVYQVICNMIDDNVPVWLFGRELPVAMTRNWLNFTLAGDRNIETRKNEDGGFYSVVTPQAKKGIDKFLNEMLWSYKDDADANIDELIESIVACIRTYGCRVAVIDNLMVCDVADDKKDELAAQTEIIKKLIATAAKYNIAIILVAHPRKMQNGQELDMYDIAGTSKIANLAHRTLAMKRLDANSNGGYSAEISIIKDRILGKLGFKMPMYYSPSCRRFYTDYEEYSKNYSWDKNNDKPLPVPQVLSQTPIFNNPENEVFGVTA